MLMTVPRLSLAAIRANSALVTPFNTPRSPPVVLRVEPMLRENDMLPPQSMRRPPTDAPCMRRPIALAATKSAAELIARLPRSRTRVTFAGHGSPQSPHRALRRDTDPAVHCRDPERPTREQMRTSRAPAQIDFGTPKRRERGTLQALRRARRELSRQVRNAREGPLTVDVAAAAAAAAAAATPSALAQRPAREPVEEAWALVEATPPTQLPLRLLRPLGRDSVRC